MDLSIVIPAYNEADRLPGSLKKIRTYCDHSSRTIEIVVVDDGSTDGTAAAAKNADPSIRVITHPHNLGKGAAVRTGMLAAQGAWRYLCDSDLSTPITELDRFIDASTEADIVIGSRAVSGANVARRQSLWKTTLGKMGNLVIQIMAVRGIKDSQCGFKLFSARTMDIFTRQRINRWGYDFEVLFMARRDHWRIKELPVTWVNDERSKVKPLDYFHTLYELLTIRLNDWRGLYKKT